MAPAIYGGAMLGLLLLAYLTKAQPVWLPRYGLIFFAIGLPMFARVLQWIVASMPGRGGKALVVIGVICASLIEMSKQVSTLANVQTDFRAHQQIAATLANDLKAAPADARCFSDDAAVRVLSKLPAERFLRSPFVPASAASSADAFLDWLHRQRIGWLVFFPTEDSVPVKLFPQLSKSHAGSPNFTLIASAHSTFGPDIWLYRVRQSSAVDGAAP
jgi:type IV secretory pathway VirB2 component (pilin)